MNTTIPPHTVSRSDATRIVIGTVYMTFCVILIFTIVLVVKNKIMTLASKILLGNLMVAHFGYWLHGLIRTSVIQYIQGMDCMIMIYIIVAQLYASVFAVAAVAADRFVATRFPFKYMEIRGTYIALFVVFLWTVAPFFSLATFVGADIDASNACEPWASLPVSGLVLFGVTVTFSTMSVFAMCIYVGKEVHRHVRSINDTAFALTRDRKQKTRGLVKQLDTTLTFGLIALSHCLMVFPLIIIFPLLATERYDESTLVGLLLIFGTCSRVSDPFIYILRTKMKNSKCCRCLPSFVSTKSSPCKSGNTSDTRLTGLVNSDKIADGVTAVTHSNSAEAKKESSTKKITMHGSIAVIETAASPV